MIQMLTPFRADQYVYQGGAALGAGIGGGLQNLGDALGKALEEKKRKGQLATSLRKTLTVAYPERKDEFATMGLPDLQGTLEGEAMKSRFAKMKQEQQVQQAQLAEFLAKQNERKSMTDIASQLAQQGQAPGSLPFDISPEEFDRRTAEPDLMSAIAKLGPGRGISPAGAADLAMALEKMKPRQSMGPEMLKQFGFVPTGGQVNPNGSASLTFGPPDPVFSKTATPILTDTGQPTGKALFEGKPIDLPADRSQSLTEAQANALSYSERMKYNNAIVSKLEGSGFNPAGMGAAIQDWTPNFMNSEVFQQYNAAQRNWVSAVLRKESGAAISKSEEQSAVKQYFPSFGDSPGTVAQKAALRLLAEENMRKAIGNIQRDGKASLQSAPDSELAAAKAAITAGKDPAAVKKRYKERTGQDFSE